jgi:hypothetical protein
LCFKGKITNLAFACFDFDDSNIGFAIARTTKDGLLKCLVKDFLIAT